MGLPLTMEPNYETYECQFRFGKTPDEETEVAALSSPCLARCPTAGSLRAKHQGMLEEQDNQEDSAAPICSYL